LDGEDLLVTELAAPFAISLQAVSRHIQVLVKAGLVVQQRTGRISRCRLDAGPILTASLWLNRYSRYWQSQFDTLAMWLDAMSAPTHKESPRELPRDHRQTSRVPARDRRAARQDAGTAANRRTRGSR
jgi:DNA-binding transcriptional ArsR family regulator